MFVQLNSRPHKKASARSVLAVLAALLSFGVPATAFAGTSHSDKGTIPVTVSIENLRAGDVPLYISVQKRGQYKGVKGYGAILKSTNSGTMQAVIKVDDVDDYAVSLWHDLDNDGVFSMDKRYRPKDGWAASGTVPKGRPPKFDDVKVSIPIAGKAVTVRMIYPD